MRYVSLLRGINVGGHKKIRMVDLKATYERLGLGNVVTYIQSGNVVFTAGDQSPASLRDGIKQAIAHDFGFQVPVVLRTHEQLQDVLAGCPFGEVDLKLDGSKIMVTFLERVPDATQVAVLQPYVVAPEELVAAGRELYLRCPHGSANSKLNNVLVERKLGQAVTTRNWRTVCKLIELSVQDNS